MRTSAVTVAVAFLTPFAMLSIALVENVSRDVVTPAVTYGILVMLYAIYQRIGEIKND